MSEMYQLLSNVKPFKDALGDDLMLDASLISKRQKPA
jgi:hypothetical protein